MLKMHKSALLDVRAKREWCERELQILIHAEQYHAAELKKLESRLPSAEECECGGITGLAMLAGGDE
jgi:hypothetical protein